jgi:Zn-dependent protease with chaperone function
MLVAISLTLLASALLGGASTRFARAVPPGTATRVLSLAALVTALANGFVVSVVSFDFLAQFPRVARARQWSTVGLQGEGHVPSFVGVLAVVTLTLLLGASLRRAALLGRDLWVASQTCRRLDVSDGVPVVVDDPVPDAYALPGLVTGRVVVSTGMLQALDVDERRALLAHEASHLAHRHHLYLAATGLAAAANPLLRPVASAVRRSVERWADEDAAQAVDDRRLVARALARAGLAIAAARRPETRHPRPAGLLGVAGLDVSDRAHALLRPPPRRRRGLVAALLIVAMTAIGGSAVLAHTTETRFERAHAAFVSATATE